MPIIDTPAGTLEVTNAILSASEFRATQKISVSNSAPTKNFSVGDKFHVSTTDADAVNITGNLVAQKLKIGNLLVSPTFDLAAVSNVGNTTSNTLQFANATTSFVASSNVEIGGNITLTSNAQVKVGSNVLAEYTGPHGREPKEMPLKKYPEIAFDASKLDGNDTTNTYVQAGYTVTSSSVQSGYAGHEAFNGKINTELDAWRSLTLYTTGTGAYSVSTNSVTALDAPSGTSTTYNGEWLQIQMPKSIKLSHFVLHPQGHTTLDLSSRLPGTGVMVGSTDGSTWYLLKRFVNLSHRDNLGTKIVVDTNTTSYYKYFRILAEKTSPNGSTYDTDAAIGELELYGYGDPAPPGDLSLDTTLKSTFNSVRSNNYVMYFDGEDPAAGNVPKNLVNDSSISITPHNAVFDTTNNCWTLDGSTESNVTTGSLGFEGDVPHTVSTWINASNLEANALTQQLFSIGSGYDKAFLKVDDTQIAANTWHNVTYAYQGEGGSKVTYVDGRKVEEAQAEDTFGVYPRFGMTGYKTGGYCVSASSEYENSNEYPAWQAFDHDTTTNGNQWICATGLYENNGTYTGTTSTVESSNTWTGEYLQLELPYKIRVSDVQILREINVTYGTSRSPNTGAILGSNDGYNWSYILNFTNKPHTDYTDTVFSSLGTSSGTDSYKYLRLVVTKIQDESVTSNSNGNLISICEIRYYGHKEGDLTRFPEPTRVLKYPHILTKNGTGDGFTSATSAPEYGKRGYVIKASSSIASYPPYAAFNGETHVATGTTWIGGFNSYGTNNSGVSVDGGYKTVGTMNLKTNLGTGGSATSDGEWLYIEMPSKITVTSTNIISNDGAGYPPDYVVIYGTNDPSSSGGWNVVDNTYVSSSSGIPNSADGKTWTVSTASNPVAYKYFALVIVKVNSTAGYSHAVITEWKLYGTEEDTGTPAIVGGPFAGKVANFRVYDKYLGDERIQEIYDAQKDEFGHKKSSMTFYKGRVGVGTTEPEGALTVIDEPHALEKFPARAVSANDSYVEGQGTFHISSSIRGGSNQTDSIAWQPFGNLSCTFQPPRHERISEEVDFGAWHKIESPYAISLKKAEIGLEQTWLQIGSTLQSGASNHTMGRSVASNKDGTRIAISRVFFADTLSNQGLVQVFDWNGTNWVQVGNNILGDAAQDQFGKNDLELDDEGNTLIVGSKEDGAGSVGGQVDVYYLNGATWSIKGNVFDGNSAAEIGSGVSISADGNTIAFSEMGFDNLSPSVTDSGRVRAFTWSGSAWVQKGSDMIGAANEKIGATVNMTPDGNYIITSNESVSSGNGKVWVYAWDGSAWQLRYSQTGTGTDYLGYDTNISDDGNVIAIGEFTNDDLAADHGAVHIRRWNGSTYALDQTLFAKYYTQDPAGDYFGSGCKLSGDGTRLIAGSRYVPGTGNSSRGRLYTFEYNGSSWIRRGTIKDFAPTYGTEGAEGTTGSGADIGWQNTFAISRDGSVITVGAPGDDTYHTNGGSAKIFQMASNVKGIWGSNDDKNWTKITGDSKAVRVNEEVEFTNIDNPNYYKYHGIVYDNFSRVEDIKLFGVRNQGSSTLHDGALTLTKNLDVPRIGPPLDADDTPRRDRLVVEYNTSTNPVEDGVVRDTSGRGFDGCLKGGAYYDATEKALKFDGTGDYTEVQLPRHQVKGDWIHSVSCWVKGNVINGEEAVWNIGDRTGNPSGVQASTSTLSFNSASPTLRWYFYSNDGSTNLYTINEGDWNHIVCVYYGGGHTGTNSLVYINGNKVLLNSFTASAPLLFDETRERVLMLGRLAWGTNSDLNGSISNFKLYDVALTPEEAKTLYDMGRCDEGHHVVNFSKTRVGIGLGDGEAPTSTLDVRGTFQGNSPLRFYVLSGVHPSSATTVTVPFNEHLKRGAQIVSFTGSTTTDTGSVVPWNYHNETNQYEIMVFWNVSQQAFNFFGQGTSVFGLQWKMFVVTT